MQVRLESSSKLTLLSVSMVQQLPHIDVLGTVCALVGTAREGQLCPLSRLTTCLVL